MSSQANPKLKEFFYKPQQFREEVAMFRYLRDSRYISVYEQVAMLMLTIGHNCRNYL